MFRLVEMSKLSHLKQKIEKQGREFFFFGTKYFFFEFRIVLNF